MNQSYPFSSVRPAAEVTSVERAAFIRRTYLHLAGAIALFVGLEYLMLTSDWFVMTIINAINSSRYSWLLVIAAFVMVSWFARSSARSIASPAMQYFGLGIFVLAQAVVFVPMMIVAIHFSTQNVLPTAAFLTAVLFGALTLFALTTRKDFSFLRGFLVVGGVLSLGTIAAGIIFGFDLGLWFSAAMIFFASAAILYDTSKVLLHYPTNMHVAASLELFASVALLFLYILRLLSQLNRS